MLANQLSQKKALLSENYLRKQNDIQINMLEQEIDTKLLHNDDEIDNTGSLDMEKKEIDAQMVKY